MSSGWCALSCQCAHESPGFHVTLLVRGSCNSAAYTSDRFQVTGEMVPWTPGGKRLSGELSECAVPSQGQECEAVAPSIPEHWEIFELKIAHLKIKCAVLI